MIRLWFMVGREMFMVEVNGREIFYLDRKMKRKARMIPVDEEIQKIIIKSRNTIPKNVIDMYSLTAEEQKEYESCKNESELAEVCIRDAIKSGARLVKKEVKDVQT